MGKTKLGEREVWEENRIQNGKIKKKNSAKRKN